MTKFELLRNIIALLALAFVVFMTYKFVENIPKLEIDADKYIVINDLLKSNPENSECHLKLEEYFEDKKILTWEFRKIENCYKSKDFQKSTLENTLNKTNS